MARNRLTQDEVTTAAQLAGVPPALALSIWQKDRKGGVGEFKLTPAMFKRHGEGSINDPVDNMHAGLAVIADGLRQSGGDWEEAIRFYYQGKTPANFRIKRTEFDDEMPESANKFYNSRELKRPLYKNSLSNKSYSDYGLPLEQDRFMDSPLQQPYNMTEEGEYNFDEGVFEGDPDAELDIGNEIDMPGFTRAMHRTMPYDTFNQELNNKGSREYEMDRYIRRLVNEEFDNGRPVRT
jgi:hypothetical protein